MRRVSGGLGSAYVNIKLHPTPGEEGPHTLPDLLGAAEELTREVPEAAAAILKGQGVHPEAFLLQQVFRCREQLASVHSIPCLQN